MASKKMEFKEEEAVERTIARARIAFLLSAQGTEDSMSRSLARDVERIAAIYLPPHRIRLMARVDRFGRGSDHSSFNQYGYPAIVFRESNENFARQHSPNDTLEGVDFRSWRRTPV